MFSLVISASLLGSPHAAPSASLMIPTVRIEVGQSSTVIPDWTKLSFETIPAPDQAGSFEGRNWLAGQSLKDVLTLGDFQDSFKLQDLNLYAIALATQTPLKTIHLQQFRLLQRQTLSDLIDAIPELGKHPVIEIKPLAALLHTAQPNNRLAEETLPDLLAQDPNLGALRFQNFDLSRYTLKDIPGLAEVPLQAFHGWQEAKITDIPGLATMPWSKFPNPPNDGANLIGKAFRLVVSEVDPQKTKTALYFRFCHSADIHSQLSCSPYVVGPIPFFNYQNSETLPAADADTTTISTPDFPPPILELPATPPEVERPPQNTLLGTVMEAIAHLKTLLPHLRFTV